MNSTRLLSFCTFVVLLTAGCAAHNKMVKKNSQEKPVAAPVVESKSEKTTELSNQATSSPLKTVYFAFDRYNLTPEARENLKENIEWLKSHPGTMIRTEGRCDQRGTVEYNLVLGQERADAVKHYYAEAGVKPTSISTISYGKEKPVCDDADESCWSQNRQVDSVIVQANYAAKP